MQVDISCSSLLLSPPSYHMETAKCGSSKDRVELTDRLHGIITASLPGVVNEKESAVAGSLLPIPPHLLETVGDRKDNIKIGM